MTKSVGDTARLLRAGAAATMAASNADRARTRFIVEPVYEDFNETKDDQHKQIFHAKSQLV